MKALAVFVVTAAIDIIWTLCVRATSERRAGAASSWAAVLVVCASFNTLSIVESPALVIPAALGAFVGTYLAVKPWR